MICPTGKSMIFNKKETDKSCVQTCAHEQKSLRKSESFLKSTSVDFDDDTMETDLDLVDLQEDRSGFNRNKPIKQVLTVQEKLAQDYPSLPPQAEVYMNLLDDDFAAGVDQPSSYHRYMSFCSINCSY